jgi:hypothetical protein
MSPAGLGDAANPENGRVMGAPVRRGLKCVVDRFLVDLYQFSKPREMRTPSGEIP